jgi:hypothetical protein
VLFFLFFLSGRLSRYDEFYVAHDLVNEGLVYSIGVLGYSIDLSTIVLPSVFLSEKLSPFSM